MHACTSDYSLYGYTQSLDLSVQSHDTHIDDPWEVNQDHSFEVGSVHGEGDGLRAHGLSRLDADPHLTLNLSAEATKVSSLVRSYT